MLNVLLRTVHCVSSLQTAFHRESDLLHLLCKLQAQLANIYTVRHNFV